ncbi:phosphoesterase family-domain-containing protein [Suillus paluster]|uniref:phosphoesterase family-domain-containing protein n=1 Tax=Suillus paluster TaxID=48578 RepID=UPI001B8708AB|nr:phosphoesterase family-domain-containing protein [Suillus paluster]KAG1738600.1 phosphoesterase family-domain-containing protein [Suillus paluster]
MIVPSVVTLAVLARTASAAVAPTFTTPAPAPTSQSPFYIGAANTTLTNTPVVPGKVFDRFIQIWLENTDFATAASQGVFQTLAAQGITLSGYYGVTHPSEPNYLAVAGGDFWGLGADSLEYIPTNISTVVDLLDQKNISWASYQENMPTDGYTGYNYTNAADGYTYYVRKHNPLIIYDSVATIPTRAARIRNFNDFAVDVGNNSLSQWIFITPNLRNDAHDTNVAYTASWLNYWLVPLLSDPNFNTARTLILLTFDENETYTIGNQVYSVLLGGVIPQNMKNTTDATFYTHYSTLSTVENNWDLGNLGRQDTNKTVSNVFNLVASATSYKNNNLTGSSSGLPQLNITGTIPGPLNPDYYVPYLAPTNGTGGGSGPTFVASNINKTLTPANAPAPVNISATSTPTPTTTTSSATGLTSNAGNMVAAAAVAVVAAMLL